MAASLLTSAGASVGVSISTQRRMPSRMELESKGLVGVPVSMLLPTTETNLCHSALVGTFARGDLLDQFDDTAAQLGIGDARKRARQRQALGSREKIRNVSRRGAFAETVGAGAAARAAVEQKR